MSELADDPLLALLTDIADGVVTLAAHLDAIEAAAAQHRADENEALATIAEIAARSYYASNPVSPLPDDLINAHVMDAMIERWPPSVAVAMTARDRQIFNQLEDLSLETIEAMVAHVQGNPDAGNAKRVLKGAFLRLLELEKARRERDAVLEREASQRRQ